MVAVIAVLFIVSSQNEQGPDNNVRTILEQFSDTTDGTTSDTTDGTTNIQDLRAELDDGRQIININIGRSRLGYMTSENENDLNPTDPEPQLASQQQLAGCEGIMETINDRLNDPRYEGSCNDNSCPRVILPSGNPTEFTSATEFSYGDDGENRVKFMGDKISEQIDSIDRTFKFPVEDERCKFIKDTLGSDAENYIFFNDNRLLTHPYSGEPEVCYMPPHIGNVSYDDNGCSAENSRLYHDDFEDVVDKDGIKMAVNQRAEGEDTYRPMCEIRFKKTATKERIGEYLQFLYNKEPEREYWQRATSWLFNKHFEDTTTMAAYMNQLALQNNEINTLTSGLENARTRAKVYEETLRRYLIPQNYMYDYLFQEAVPPDAIADERLRKLEMNLAKAAYEQKLDINTGDSIAKDADPDTEVVGVGRHLSKLYLEEDESKEDALRRNITEWSEYSEGRKPALNNVITEKADLARVWDRERDKVEAQNLEYSVKQDPEYAIKRVKAAELPEGPEGYKHTENCTYRDENGEDSCNAQFLQGCAFENIDKNAQSTDICGWALGKDGNQHNCTTYGDMFQRNGGIDNYFDVLTEERDGNKQDVTSELDAYLKDKQGFNGFQEDKCLYREEDDGDCDAAFRNQCARVNVSASSSPDWVYLLDGRTRLVQAKPRVTNDGIIEIVGDVQTTVNPDDDNYVEIVDASNGNLNYITERTQPMARLKNTYLEKLKNYDALQTSGQSSATKLINLKNRLSNIETDCTNGVIECNYAKCEENEDDLSCDGNPDKVTARLTVDAEAKLNGYDSFANRTVGCDTDNFPNGEITCQIISNTNGDTAIPNLGENWEINPKGTMDNCNNKGGGNTQVTGAGVYNISGPNNGNYTAAKLNNDKWYKVEDNGYKPLNSNSANELIGNDNKVQYYNGKFWPKNQLSCPDGQSAICVADNSSATVYSGSDKYVYVSNTVIDNNYNNDNTQDGYEFTLHEAMTYCTNNPRFCEAFSWKEVADPNVKNQVYFKDDIDLMEVELKEGKLVGKEVPNKIWYDPEWGTYIKLEKIKFPEAEAASSYTVQDNPNPLATLNMTSDDAYKRSSDGNTFTKAEVVCPDGSAAIDGILLHEPLVYHNLWNPYPQDDDDKFRMGYTVTAIQKTADESTSSRLFQFRLGKKDGHLTAIRPSGSSAGKIRRDGEFVSEVRVGDVVKPVNANKEFIIISGSKTVQESGGGEITAGGVAYAIGEDGVLKKGSCADATTEYNFEPGKCYKHMGDDMNLCIQQELNYVGGVMDAAIQRCKAKTGMQEIPCEAANAQNEVKFRTDDKFFVESLGKPGKYLIAPKLQHRSRLGAGTLELLSRMTIVSDDNDKFYFDKVIADPNKKYIQAPGTDMKLVEQGGASELKFYREGINKVFVIGKDQNGVEYILGIDDTENLFWAPWNPEGTAFKDDRYRWRLTEAELFA